MLPSLQYRLTEEKTPFSFLERISFRWHWGEVPRYLVTALSGTIEKDSISFSLNFGDFPTRYSSRISTLPDKVSPLKTFPLRGWILIIFMTSLGLVLKKIPNIPPEFTASFYSGLGPMLILAACRFVRNGIK